MKPNGGCEASLRCLIAYIWEKRHRRLAVYTIAFLVIFSALERLFSSAFSLFTILLMAVVRLSVSDIYPNSTVLGLALSVITLILPLALTILVFIWLSIAFKARPPN